MPHARPRLPADPDALVSGGAQGDPTTTPQALLDRWMALSADLTQAQVALVDDLQAYARHGIAPQTPLVEQQKLLVAKMELAGELLRRVLDGLAGEEPGPKSFCRPGS
jgi:hypothetical protein